MNNQDEENKQEFRGKIYVAPELRLYIKSEVKASV